MVVVRQRTFVEARIQLGEILSAVEFVDQRALQMVVEHTPGGAACGLMASRQLA